jgi:catechol 2,3-dioxygenase-like lactoylglutathione lyase family enzyme
MEYSPQHTVIPVLRIFDLPKAREFYVDWLGFKVDWEHRFEPNTPVYMQISLDNILFHLSEHFGDGTPGTKIYIDFVSGLETYLKTLTAKNYKYYRPSIEKAFWNARIMEVCDPFGNKILFVENIPE